MPEKDPLKVIVCGSWPGTNKSDSQNIANLIHAVRVNGGEVINLDLLKAAKPQNIRDGIALQRQQNFLFQQAEGGIGDITHGNPDTIGQLYALQNVHQKPVGVTYYDIDSEKDSRFLPQLFRQHRKYSWVNPNDLSEAIRQFFNFARPLTNSNFDQQSLQKMIESGCIKTGSLTFDLRHDRVLNYAKDLDLPPGYYVLAQKLALNLGSIVTCEEFLAYGRLQELGVDDQTLLNRLRTTVNLINREFKDDERLVEGEYGAKVDMFQV